MFKSLKDFILTLETEGELVRIKEKLSPSLEITEIADRESKKPGGGKALLFENNGTEFPLLINAFGSDKRIALALGLEDLNEAGNQIDELFKKITGPKQTLYDKLKVLPLLKELASWMPKSKGKKGACQEIIHHNPDLGILPVLKCWPADGGPFITLPMVHTKDLETGIRNVGMYRMQVFSENQTGMHWHLHKTGARHFEQYKAMNKKMPVAVAIGGDPAYAYAATAPLPDNIDEYMLAGFLRKKKVELVKCITQDIEVPADVDIVIEGFIDPEEEFCWEGPFGDHTGFYSLADWYPKFHVTCITHRKNAVYPATVVGIPPMEDAYLGKATERIFLKPIQLLLVPELIDFHMPFEGVAHNIVLVKIRKTYPGQAQKVMSTLWGAGQMMFTKILIVTDEDFELTNYQLLIDLLDRRYQVQTDTYFFQGPTDILDHASHQKAYSGKLGIDLTKKIPEENNLKELKQEIQKIQVPGEKSIDYTWKFIGENETICLIKLPENKGENQFDRIETFIHKQSIKAKVVLAFDEVINLEELSMISWIGAGNIDPLRDCKLVRSENNHTLLIIDARKKQNKYSKHVRDWPNIVTMDLPTIKKIDDIYVTLGLGEFVSSPSLRYRNLKFGDGAIVNE